MGGARAARLGTLLESALLLAGETTVALDGRRVPVETLIEMTEQAIPMAEFLEEHPAAPARVTPLRRQALIDGRRPPLAPCM